MDALETIFTRRSIRRYTNDPVSDEDVTLLLRAAMAAPSARNSQPWHFIVVRDQALREGIARFSPHAQMAPGAPLCIVVCVNLSDEKITDYWPQDCGAAIQNLMLAARARDIGTVWTGVYPREERVKAARELFRLPECVVPMAIVVVGHPAQPFTEKDRYNPLRVHQEFWPAL